MGITWKAEVIDKDNDQKIYYIVEHICAVFLYELHSELFLKLIQAFKLTQGKNACQLSLILYPYRLYIDQLILFII